MSKVVSLPKELVGLLKDGKATIKSVSKLKKKAEISITNSIVVTLDYPDVVVPPGFAWLKGEPIFFNSNGLVVGHKPSTNSPPTTTTVPAGRTGCSKNIKQSHLD